jgi:transposase
MQGEGAVIELIDGLVDYIQQLLAYIQRQDQIIQELQDRLAKNSKNSSKPPSSDGYRKPISLRKSGIRKNGGQKGHEGHTLMPVENPDHTVIHEVKQCSNCHTSLEDEEVIDYERRQEFDMPPVRIEVTEHKAEIKNCPICGTRNKAEFPPNVTQPIQYGTRIKSWAVYFNNYHFIPLERTCEIFEDLLDHRLSDASVLQSNIDLADNVKPANEVVKQRLIGSDVANFDESGLRVEGKLNWLHVASTPMLTYYEFHQKRGQEAMDEIGILPEFEGTAIHDHWKPYFRYDKCRHGLCNAHHLRELTFVYQCYHQNWSQKMIDLLVEIKEEVEQTKLCSDQLSPPKIEDFEKRYEETIEKGLKANPQPPEEQLRKKRRGKVKQSPPKNLLDRLKEYNKEVLAFMYDFQVPFDNNQGERDMRMVKVKQKVSGTFRTRKGADTFCCIRGYISTARKNGKKVIEAIHDAFNGTPFIPSLPMHEPP